MSDFTHGDPASGIGPIIRTEDARLDLAIPRFTLEFAAHEEEEFRDALNGSRWRLAVSEYAQELRQILKYRQELPENDAGIEEARTLLFKILEEEGLRLYD